MGKSFSSWLSGHLDAEQSKSRRSRTNRSQRTRRIAVERLEDRRMLAIDVVSLNLSGSPAGVSDYAPDITANGRYVVFNSTGANIVSGGYGFGDAYFRDVQSGNTYRLSSKADNTPANGGSYHAMVTANGAFAAFSTTADNLVTGDTNGQDDVYVKNLATWEVVRASLTSAGAELNGFASVTDISDDGRYVLFVSNATNVSGGGGFQQYIKDLQTGTLSIVSQTAGGTVGNGMSYAGKISSNGLFATFYSSSTNLVSVDNNSVGDIFLKNLTTGEVTLVSTASNGAQANSTSYDPQISADGRFVTFSSGATNLAAGASSGNGHILVKDTLTGLTTLVSSNADGSAANDSAEIPSISADGRFVAFSSIATNLTAGDTNGNVDVFVKDLLTGQMTNVIRSASSVQGNSDSYGAKISADGKYVTFRTFATNLGVTDTNNTVDIVRATVDWAPTVTGATQFFTDKNLDLVSRVTGEDLDGDALTVAVVSTTSHGNLFVNADGAFRYRPTTNYTGADSFTFTVTAGGRTSAVVTANIGVNPKLSLLSRAQGTTTTTSNENARGQAVSSDGRYVVFDGFGTDLVSGTSVNRHRMYRHDRVTGEFVLVTPEEVEIENPSINGDGRFVSFQTASALVGADTNSNYDVYVKDMVTGSYQLASAASDGAVGDGYSVLAALDASGRYLVLTSDATNFVGATPGEYSIYLKDLWTNRLEHVAIGYRGSLSADGNVVAFISDASNLVSGDTNNTTDLFVWSRTTKQIQRANTQGNGGQTTDFANPPITFGPQVGGLSADGRYVAFLSSATDLVTGDTNGVADVFVKDIETGAIVRASVAANGAQSDGNSYYAGLSADGRFVGFSSYASNLVPNDTNGTQDAFVKDLRTGQIVSLWAGAGIQGDNISYNPKLTGDARYAIVGTSATNLGFTDSNGRYDIVAASVAWAPTVTGTTSFFVDKNRRFNSKVTAEDVNGDQLVFSMVAGPTNGQLTFGSSGSFSYLPNTNYTGTDSFTFKVTANGQETAVTTVNLRVGVPIGLASHAVGTSATTSNELSHEAGVSNDGRYITYAGYGGNLVTGDDFGNFDIFRYDTLTDTTVRVSGGTYDNVDPSISGDGRFISYESNDPILGHASNNRDVFVKDMNTGTIVLASSAADGTPSNSNSFIRTGAIDSSGRYVVFDSYASNLVPGDTGDWDVFLKDLTTNAITLIADGKDARISANGEYVIFRSGASSLVPGDTNGTDDLFRWTRKTGKFDRINTTASGGQSTIQWHHELSADGVSDDGRFVLFSTGAEDLGPWTGTVTDVFLKDMLTGNIVCLSLTPSGQPSIAFHHGNSLSPDGRFASFHSNGPDLGGTDTNGVDDVYVIDLKTGQRIQPLHSQGLEGNGDTRLSRITSDGKQVVFQSYSSNLGFTDGNSQYDIFRTNIQWAPTVSGSHIFTTNEDTSLEYHVVAEDLNNDWLDYATATGPAHGSVDWTAGTFTYTPHANFFGTDSFTFTVSDGLQTSAPTTVNITVTPVNDAPVANADTLQVVKNRPLTINIANDLLANDIDAENNKSFQNFSSTSSNGTLANNNNGTLTFRPTIGYVGPVNFTYTIIDGAGVVSSPATVTINVVQPTRDVLSAELGIAFNPTTGIWQGMSVTPGRTENKVLASWTPNSPTETWREALTGDFNGDDVTDVAARKANGVWQVGASRLGGYDTATWGWFSPTTNWTALKAVDINGDGCDDIVGFEATHGTWWGAISTGTGFTTSQLAIWSTAVTWQDILVGDFTGDDKVDVIGRTNGGGWWLGRSTGAALVPDSLGTWSTAVTWLDVKPADYNGDGRLDVVGRAYSPGIERSGWWTAELQQVSPTDFAIVNRSLATWYEAANWTVFIADANGDGRDDVLGRTAAGAWWWTRSNGTTNNTSLLGNWMDGTWLATAVGDVDGDGRGDLIGLRSDGQVRVSRYPTGDGSQTNYQMGSLLSPQNWTYFNFGFDDDLLLD